VIGVLVVGHNNLAEELIKSLETITGNLWGIESVGFVKKNETISDLKLKIKQKIDSLLKEFSKVIILIDLDGGECLQAVLEVQKSEKNLKDKIGIISGVNLSMLINILSHRCIFSDREFKEVLSLVQKAGRRSIVIF
jgi:mannose/fructose-specific phosphotransferase system component IIA